MKNLKVIDPERPLDLQFHLKHVEIDGEYLIDFNFPNAETFRAKSSYVKFQNKVYPLLKHLCIFDSTDEINYKNFPNLEHIGKRFLSYEESLCKDNLPKLSSIKFILDTSDDLLKQFLANENDESFPDNLLFKNNVKKLRLFCIGDPNYKVHISAENMNKLEFLETSFLIDSDGVFPRIKTYKNYNKKFNNDFSPFPNVENIYLNLNLNREETIREIERFSKNNCIKKISICYCNEGKTFLKSFTGIQSCKQDIEFLDIRYNFNSPIEKYKQVCFCSHDAKSWGKVLFPNSEKYYLNFCGFLKEHENIIQFSSFMNKIYQIEDKRGYIFDAKHSYMRIWDRKITQESYISEDIEDMKIENCEIDPGCLFLNKVKNIQIINGGK